ncbi:hypothetical protein E2C01_002998 [Portunus trituberculatus]|uniref:Uncharacterized protein n=1 Tax=Portunus trituberculatus TaxID=210409 RepID=A0A5B7CLR1_PORTR|nr:hypothetical protein [Portunus trituberculatus]
MPTSQHCPQPPCRADHSAALSVTHPHDSHTPVPPTPGSVSHAGCLLPPHYWVSADMTRNIFAATLPSHNKAAQDTRSDWRRRWWTQHRAGVLPQPPHDLARWKKILLYSKARLCCCWLSGAHSPCNMCGSMVQQGRLWRCAGRMLWLALLLRLLRAEVKQVVRDGTFCRVLLSMHASCSEVLDLVSYLRPRKVYPNVIPTNSTREEVLKLLHEALNRSGDHYSIEYGGAQQRRSMGSFKRQLRSNESSGSSNLEAAMYDGFLSSPSKRRRHSDSNMTLVLPTPRVNMKGSLSLESEARCDPSTATTTTTSTATTTTTQATTEPSPGPSLEWVDPYPPSPASSSSPCKYPDVPGLEDSQAGLRPRVNLAARLESDGGSGSRQVIVKMRGAGGVGQCGPGSGASHMSVDGDGEEDGDAHSVISFVKTSQDSLELASVFSEDARESPGPSPPAPAVERPASSAGVAGESDIKRDRKLWYQHKHFSTPVHDDHDKRLKTEPKVPLGPRSSSLPLPEPRPTSPDLSPGPALPLITVSSPSDPASESQVSDETSVTAVLSGASDLDAMLVDEAPPERPSVICGPAVAAPRGEARPAPDSECGPELEDLLLRSRRAEERSSCLKTTRRRDNELEYHSICRLKELLFLVILLLLLQQLLLVRTLILAISSVTALKNKVEYNVTLGATNVILFSSKSTKSFSPPISSLCTLISPSPRCKFCWFCKI